jgi:hypothetical protein
MNGSEWRSHRAAKITAICTSAENVFAICSKSGNEKIDTSSVTTRLKRIETCGLSYLSF